MKPFIHDNFLLQNSISESLYHETAKDLPVIDYHNHLDPEVLARNLPFRDISRLWINPDPYKHRAMRINGIPEAGITGDTTDQEKFHHWARTFPKTLGNPLFHWTCLELKRVFGIDELLNEENAARIRNNCNEQLAAGGFSPVELLRRFDVELLCTSDDLLDDLQPHSMATRQHNIPVLPSLRGDTMLGFQNPGFRDWLDRLEGQTNTTIQSLEEYQEAIVKKLDSFEEAGCQFADHALDSGFRFAHPSPSVARTLFRKCLSGEKTGKADYALLKSYMLVFLGKAYAARDWTLQLHIGALRGTSSRLSQLAGPNGGYAAIGNTADVESIAAILNTVESTGSLPKIIFYTLNPADNETFASLTGSYAEDGVPGKVQLGPAWWYNDHLHGIRDHLMTLANYGLMHHFIGMTTDSRSLLSMSRHEYFRRALCNLLGEWVEKGYLPGDPDLLASTVQAVCYGNIKKWITQKNNIHVNEKIKE